MSFYFCRSCYKSNWEDKKLEFFCGIRCGHIFCTSCLCEECKTCGIPYTHMKIGPDMNGHFGLLFQELSELPKIMKRTVEFQNQRIQEFNTKISVKVLAGMACSRKKRESNVALIKKIEGHIKEEKKRITYIQNKVRELVSDKNC